MKLFLLFVLTLLSVQALPVQRMGSAHFINATATSVSSSAYSKLTTVTAAATLKAIPPISTIHPIACHGVLPSMSQSTTHKLGSNLKNTSSPYESQSTNSTKSDQNLSHRGRGMYQRFIEPDSEANICYLLPQFNSTTTTSTSNFTSNFTSNSTSNSTTINHLPKAVSKGRGMYARSTASNNTTHDGPTPGKFHQLVATMVGGREKYERIATSMKSLYPSNFAEQLVQEKEVGLLGARDAGRGMYAGVEEVDDDDDEGLVDE